MKTICLDIIKKNRVYFKCLTENGYEVKLKITAKSENLELGKQNLLVRDVSVKTKYGTDIMYELEESIKDDRVVTLFSRYNHKLVEQCKKLGGRWDSHSKAWVFSVIVEDKVEELDELFNTNIITAEITAKIEIHGGQGAVNFCGYPVAKAFGRDSGAKVCDGVALIKGDIGSGGSQKNWATIVSLGSVFRLQVSATLLKQCSFSDTWDVREINQEGFYEQI